MLQKHSWKGWTIAACLFFAAIVAAEQIWKYRSMQDQIGMYAYSEPQALLQIGQYREYIGRVNDIRWNALPKYPDDLKGYQPRYLIARETLPGVTETQWWSAYFFVLAPTRPLQIKPAPFPPVQTLDPDAVMR